VPNFTIVVKKYGKYESKLIYALKVLLSLSLFSRNSQFLENLFFKRLYTEFDENPTNILVADIMSQKDRRTDGTPLSPLQLSLSTSSRNPESCSEIRRHSGN